VSLNKYQLFLNKPFNQDETPYHIFSPMKIKQQSESVQKKEKEKEKKEQEKKDVSVVLSGNNKRKPVIIPRDLSALDKIATSKLGFSKKSDGNQVKEE
jgi:hypothetical protein